jgi:alanine racemase
VRGGRSVHSAREHALWRDEEIAVEEIATKLDTISYEVFCAISKRVPRVFIAG